MSNKVHFKETGHWIDPDTQALRIDDLKSVYYVNTQEDFYITVRQLEAMGKGWSAGVVDLPNESCHKDNTHRDLPNSNKGD